MLVFNRAERKTDFNTDDIRSMFIIENEGGDYSASLHITRFTPAILTDNTYVAAFPVDIVVFNGTLQEVKLARQVLRDIANWQTKPSHAFDMLKVWSNQNDGTPLTSTNREEERIAAEEAEELRQEFEQEAYKVQETEQENLDALQQS